MKVNFQTQHKSGNIRLNAAIANVAINEEMLSIKFSRSTYDIVELEKTVNRHLARGNQNMIVTLDGKEIGMVVEPTSIEPYMDDDVILTSYKILARDDH